MQDLDTRFWARVDRTEGCWLWKTKVDNGYGRFYVAGRRLLAHRWAYERFVGPIPDGLQIDHLCRIPKCVNPSHMEVVTPQVNQLRSDSVSGLNARKTHCVHGHEFNEKNTYIVPTTGERRCTECKRLRQWKARHGGREWSASD